MVKLQTQNTDFKEKLENHNINTDHLKEINFLKDEISRLNIEFKQSELAEEVCTKEKSGTKKQLEEIENQLNLAKLEIKEYAQIKESVKKLDEELDKCKNTEKTLSNKLSDASAKLKKNEDQNRELEVLYEETKKT